MVGPMANRRELRVALLVALTLLGAAVLGWNVQGGDEAAKSTREQSDAPKPTRTDALPMQVESAQRSGPVRATAPQVVVPPSRTVLNPPAAAARDSTSTAAAPRGRLIDRRTDPGANAPSEREQLGYAVETLDEDVEACLAEWSKSQVEVSGEVMLAVQIDPTGMKEAWVEREGEVPLGPRSCFANAAFGIDWSHMVDSPVKITRRYTFPADAGR